MLGIISRKLTNWCHECNRNNLHNTAMFRIRTFLLIFENFVGSIFKLQIVFKLLLIKCITLRAAFYVYIFVQV